MRDSVAAEKLSESDETTLASPTITLEVNAPEKVFCNKILLVTTYKWKVWLT
ncbi:MAG: hypothetical protein RIB79_15685 [Allomuricauda sp.]